MSVAAMAWARERKCGSPSAKLILICLADFANQDGECFPSISLLAELTEQSPNTVRRRLQELEGQGVIERRPQFRDNGSQTVDLIRLRFEPRMQPALPSSGKGPLETPPSNLGGQALPNQEGPPPTVGKPPLPTVGGPEPPSEPSYESTPLAPKGGASADSSDEPQFDSFRAGWSDRAAGASWKKALGAWSQLSQADRVEAQLRLSRYLDDCRAKDRKVCHPSTYLIERRWESYHPASPSIRRRPDPLTLAVDEARNPKADREDWVFVEADSPSGRAWVRAFALVPRALAAARECTVEDGDGSFVRRRGWYFPSEFPPCEFVEAEQKK